MLNPTQTQRAIENFQISGEHTRPELIRAYLRIKAAAALANEKCGALDPPRAKLIHHAIRELFSLNEAEWSALFPIDIFQAGAGTNLNMNVNEVIAEAANRLAQAGQAAPLVDAHDHVNCSQSTNDSFPSAMRMALVEAGALLAEELRLCAATLSRHARDWWEIPKAARTHLQDAPPIRLGQEVRAWSSTFSRLAAWIGDGRDACRELGLGGSAVGNGLNVPPGFQTIAIAEISRLSGEEFRSSPDLFEAMQSQAPVVFYTSMLKLMALELTRIGNDLRLLASGPMNGLAEITLPTVQSGSSIMPGKINPSVVEMANQTWFAVLGFDQTVAFAAQAGQLELNVMMPIMAHSALEATRISARALRTLRTLALEGLKPNLRRLREYYENTPQIATTLSPVLGYEKTAELVKEALSSGKNVIELVRSKALMPERLLNERIDPKRVLP
jgi:aspartate ammonia-lyase